MTLPAFPGESWAGTVDYVYPTATAENRTVSIRLRFPNSDGRLKPNMYANVAIKAAPERNVLTIPQSALIRSSSGDRVILSLGDGRFRPAQVKAGIESEDRIEIISGLRPGERIVTSSQFLIDSEASLDAALLRLTSSPQPSDVNPATPSTSQAQRRISGKGRIISVDPAKRRITLEHGPIPALKWPAMRMEFGLGENVSAVALKPGDRIQFDLRAIQGGYEILEVKPVPGKARSGDGK
jgi:Cu(I)/Ag(I) efflux system membrane fusion protein